MTPAAELAAQAVAKRAQAYELRQSGRVDEAEGLEASATILERMAERMARQHSRPGEGVRFAASDDRGMTTGVVPGAPAAAGPGIPSCNPEEATVLAAIRQRTRGNAITAQDLGALIHRDPRAIRQIVSHLRAEHHEPLCSAAAHRKDEPAGYYYPVRMEDADSTLAQLESRRIEIEAAITGMRDGLGRVFGSGNLFERAA